MRKKLSVKQIVAGLLIWACIIVGAVQIVAGIYKLFVK